MRKIANTAYWVYSAAGAGSLALTVLVLMRRIGGVGLDIGPRTSVFSTMELALILTALTLAFGLFFAMPILRRVHLEQAILTDRTAKLEVAALTDPLTGLYNRRYLEDALQEYWTEFTKAGAPLAFLTIDIDHFKLINDTHGHAVGDLVLKEFAVRLGDLTRDYDVVARTGGEEFCILAPFSDGEQVVPFAERLCRTLAEKSVPIGDKNIQLTVSIGVTSTERDFSSAENLLKRSDELLYVAKRAGRNQVASEDAV